MFIETACSLDCARCPRSEGVLVESGPEKHGSGASRLHFPVPCRDLSAKELLFYWLNNQVIEK